MRRMIMLCLNFFSFLKSVSIKTNEFCLQDVDISMFTNMTSELFSSLLCRMCSLREDGDGPEGNEAKCPED